MSDGDEIVKRCDEKFNTDPDDSYEDKYGYGLDGIKAVNKTLARSELKGFTDKREFYNAIVLRVDKVNKNGKYEPGSYPFRRYEYKTNKPTFVAAKCLIPELHSMLPIPFLELDEFKQECTKEDLGALSVIEKCHHPVIDLLPTFYSQKPVQQPPGVLEYVKVTFGDEENFTEGILLSTDYREVDTNVSGAPLRSPFNNITLTDEESGVAIEIDECLKKTPPDYIDISKATIFPLYTNKQSYLELGKGVFIDPKLFFGDKDKYFGISDPSIVPENPSRARRYSSFQINKCEKNSIPYYYEDERTPANTRLGGVTYSDNYGKIEISNGFNVYRTYGRYQPNRTPFGAFYLPKNQILPEANISFINLTKNPQFFKNSTLNKIRQYAVSIVDGNLEVILQPERNIEKVIEYAIISRIFNQIVEQGVSWDQKFFGGGFIPINITEKYKLFIVNQSLFRFDINFAPSTSIEMIYNPTVGVSRESVEVISKLLDVIDQMKTGNPGGEITIKVNYTESDLYNGTLLREIFNYGEVSDASFSIGGDNAIPIISLGQEVLISTKFKGKYINPLSSLNIKKRIVQL